MARQIGTKEFNQSWLYDTNRLLNGVAASNMTFFQVPRGQLLVAGVPKTFTHTNLLTSGFLSGIKTFLISSLCFIPSPFMPSDDVNNLLQGNAALIINEKPYPDYFPMKFFMGGSNWRETIRGPVAGPDFRAFPGDARIDNVVRFKGAFRIGIDTFENFRVDVNFDGAGFSPTEDLDITLALFGRFGREVM